MGKKAGSCESVAGAMAVQAAAGTGVGDKGGVRRKDGRHLSRQPICVYDDSLRAADCCESN